MAVVCFSPRMDTKTFKIHCGFKSLGVDAGGIMLTVLKMSFRPVISVGSVEVKKIPARDVLQFGRRAFGISGQIEKPIRWLC